MSAAVATAATETLLATFGEELTFIGADALAGAAAGPVGVLVGIGIGACLLLNPRARGHNATMSPAERHSRLLTGVEIAKRESVPTRVRVKFFEDANGKTTVKAWHVSGAHELVPVIKPVVDGDKRIYQLPGGPVVTWYPGYPPHLPKNRGYESQPLDADNIMVHPMPTTEADIKAQGFPAHQSDWQDAILVFPTETGVEAVYIAYSKSPVKHLEVGLYGEMGPRSRKDGLDLDHIPSTAAYIKYLEQLNNGIQLSKKVKREIKNRTAVIAIPAEVHAKSRTYRGRNTSAQIEEDSYNLYDAAKKDIEINKQNLLEYGYSEKDIDQALMKFHGMNKKEGMY